MIHSDEKRQKLPGQVEHQMGSNVYKESAGEAWNEKEEGQIQAEERPKGVIRSVEWNPGAPM